ncbi:MAG: hypothetical protein IKV68_06475 [Oscillospiraceae bacterium]|nr:hypothetical protein [Oscillospiraceae bacterium]
MKHRAWQRWELAGLFFAIAAGNLLHFVYEWSGEHPAAALISGTNESTWEHMKLLAVPWVLWTVIQALALRGSGVPVIAARTAGLLAGVAAIPVLFYTYVGIWGKSISLINIIIFQLAVLLAYGVSSAIQRRRILSGAVWQVLGTAVLVLAAALFVGWTFAPPQLPVFVDPVSGVAGLPQ